MTRRQVTQITILVMLWALRPVVIAATTVEAISFATIVQTAERIFTGEVVGVDSFWVQGRDRATIRTRVTFSADRALRGSGVVVALEFTGGTVGDITQQIDGAPRFRVGERYVVFARDGDRWISPIVGLSQGLFPIVPDPQDGSLRVMTQARLPLASVDSIGRLQPRAARTTGTAMSLSAFLEAVRAEMARGVRQ